ncbi:MAG: hypothetical protein D6800_05815 [Candidatus Zixiibacteriota bacterium]|nr:MAG: hypothetical protein D6800_05815 [candidate division Zixibacteria bacterium]
MSNLLLDKHGRLWVLDHGLSAVPTAAGRRDDLIYLAPEILAGESATEWSDLYALGVAFCLLVTGRPPYPADSVEQLRQLILSTPVNIPDNRSRPLRPELRLVLEKLLAHQPNDRFRDAEQLAVTIDEIRRQEVEEPLAEPLDHPPAHRSPRFYLVVSAVVLLVLIVWMLLITTGGR